MMKNDKGKNGIILLLVIIIIILLTFIVLFASGVISLNVNKESTNNDDNKENIVEVEDNKEEEKINFEITYKEEVYTTKNNDGGIVATNKRSLPVISSKNNQNIADKIVNKLTSISNEFWNNSIKKTSDEMKDSGYDRLGVNYLYSTGVVNENRLSFILTMSGSFGGVSWDDVKGYNFDAKTGELLTFENISLNKENFKNVMYSKIINYIENNYDTTTFLKQDCNGNGCFDVTWQELVSKYLNYEGIWYFTDNGITVKFPKHSLADGATGIVSADIDKNDINSYLKDEYKI